MHDLIKVINGMINTSKLSTNKEQDGQFAEARRDALKGLARFRLISLTVS